MTTFHRPHNKKLNKNSNLLKSKEYKNLHCHSNLRLQDDKTKNLRKLKQ